jgi:Gluconate 2-dehydrogenase subunit 3
MKRRESLKYLFASTGVLLSLPAWAEGWTNTGLHHTTSFSATEQELLSSVADTIIPAGTSIGALSVGVDKFLQKLIDNCYEADVQSNVKNQLAALNAKAQSAYKNTFNKCSQEERKILLLQFADSNEKTEKDFFTLMKSETIRGFNTSKEVMLQHLKYKIAPGHYYGCVDVKA